MNKYESMATNLIAEAFEEHGIRFHVVNDGGSEQLLADFPVDCGPLVTMRFISRDNDNAVAARIFGLISNTPAKKRFRLMEACNVLNRRLRHLKFYLDTDGDINVEYDFPMHTPDEGIGEMAFEIFLRTMKALDSEYSIFMKALYTEEALGVRKHRSASERIQKLQELRKIIEARMEASHNEMEEHSDCLGLDSDLFDTPDDDAC